MAFSVCVLRMKHVFIHIGFHRGPFSTCARYPWLLLASDWEEGVLEHPPLRFFSRWRINDGAARRCFCHSCLDNLSAPFLNILCPGHLRSGHQVRSNNPNSNKFYNCVTGHSGGDKNLKLSGFDILPSTLQLVYLGF